MKIFIKRLLLFCLILFVIFIIGLCLPATPRASKSLLFAKYRKDSLLANCPSPRIIFIGGSGLSFGLNSKMIKDSLHLNPINTSIHGAIGLDYMFSSVSEYIRKGDLIVVAPEYQYFYGRNYYGGEELLRTVLDVSPNTIEKLDLNQWLNIYKFLPKYAFSKFKPIEYIDKRLNIYYSVNSFNEFGDECINRNAEQRNSSVYKPINESYNPKVICELLKFRKQVANKKASLYITFPGLQASSFKILKDKIDQVEAELKKYGFTLLGTPDRYKIPDSLIFDTPYHLSQVGLNLRSRLLIEDLRNLPEINNYFSYN